MFGMIASVSFVEDLLTFLTVQPRDGLGEVQRQSSTHLDAVD
jgi:hypothetical protein